MRILISGGSVAAFNAAWWLCHELGENVDVTILERDNQFRQGGQSVDIRSSGRTIIERMSLLEKVKEANTGEKGIEFVDDNGNRNALFSMDLFAAPTAELEILRGDLAQILWDKCQQDYSKQINVRFGNHIIHVEETDANVLVTLANGAKETTKPEQYDLLIVAEGVGAPTRELVFPNESKARYLDMVMAFFTMPRNDEQDGGVYARWYNSTKGRGMLLRPDRQGTTRAVLMYIDDKCKDAHKLPLEEQKQLFCEKYADAQWQTQRVLACMQESQDLYTDTLRQVKMPRWRSDKGRVVLTGDAAWCVTPLGGIGATLALIGTYVLANELAIQVQGCETNNGKSHNDSPTAAQGMLQSALKKYEDIMRPIVDDRQNIPKWIPRLLHPQSSWGVAIVRLFQRLLVSSFAQWLMKTLAPQGDEAPFPIPNYTEASKPQQISNNKQ